MNLTPDEQTEWQRLSLLWVTQRATNKQILRCMELDRKADYPVSEPLRARSPDEDR